MDKSSIPTSFDDHVHWYGTLVNSISQTDLLYTYNTVINGFLVRLTTEEAELLEQQPEVLFVREDSIYQVQTARSPDFLGVPNMEASLPEFSTSTDVIIGVLDTGVWPEIPSFNDEELGPIPSGWNGLPQGIMLATSTTVAGSTVIGASLFGFAAGTARGMARHARLASYKVCWLEKACTDSDILASMEKAIEDGVHIISVSLVGITSDYFINAIALGALSNIAPWITTVGAITIDCQFPAYVSLGNEKVLIGTSLYAGKQLTPILVPLVYAGNVSRTSTGNLCLRGSLNSKKVSGKIVLCDTGMTSGSEKGLVVKDAGGIGMILVNTFGEDLIAEAHFIPTAVVVQPSPVIAGFSSRGPNPITPDILKPDLIAPEVNILAGWTGKIGPTPLTEDIILKIGPTPLTEDCRMDRKNVIPIDEKLKSPRDYEGHVTHTSTTEPTVEPCTYKISTNDNRYRNGERIQDLATGMPLTPFDYGAGHMDPISALDPGLIYDATIDNYMDFLCAINYSSSMIKMIGKQDYSCQVGKEYSVEDLNYPSFAVPLQTASKSLTVTFTASYMPSGTTSFAHLEWTDGQHVVGSPIAFTWA
ncbi:hypothetical protein ACJIZ3_025054 [Penstemon smallii]|uniref:Uncharacterized protein n=1 Tax=Penstemon smallii TaxID=265156 RepID=A0ABD3TW55_9LAMI